MALNLVPKKKNPYNNQAFSSVTWTVGAEATNVIKVTGVLKSPHGRALAAATPLRVWLTQNATTKIVAPVAPSGTVVIAAKGAIIVSPTAKLVHDIVTNASGEFDFNITEAGAATWYMVAQLPDGTLSVSPAITFAA